jgi:hypothetical protein
MNEEFLFSIRDYAVFKGVTEETARSRLEEMVENRQAKKIKTANAPKMYRILIPLIRVHDPFKLTTRPKAPRLDDINAWMFGANITGTCYDPRI